GARVTRRRPLLGAAGLGRAGGVLGPQPPRRLPLSLPAGLHFRAGADGLARRPPLRALAAPHADRPRHRPRGLPLLRPPLERAPHLGTCPQCPTLPHLALAVRSPAGRPGSSSPRVWSSGSRSGAGAA